MGSLLLAQPATSSGDRDDHALRLQTCFTTMMPSSERLSFKPSKSVCLEIFCFPDPVVLFEVDEFSWYICR